MKLYKLKIEVIPFYISPFSFVSEWKEAIKMFYLKWRLARRFKKLRWTPDDIWEKTYYCGSLNDAIGTLAWHITDNNKLLPKARKLVSAGFENGWNKL